MSLNKIRTMHSTALMASEKGSLGSFSRNVYITLDKDFHGFGRGNVREGPLTRERCITL